MRKVLVILILVMSKVGFGQQNYSYTNYLLNAFYYNQAIAGTENVHRANVGVRRQWVGFDDAPTTYHLNFYGSYKNQQKHGYGASIVSDKTGLMQRTGFHLNYAYHLNLSENIKMGIGIKPGYLLYNIKLYDAQLADVGDEILTGNVLATNAFDMSSGVNIYSDKFFLRFSVQQLFGKGIKFTDYNDGLKKHYSMQAGYKFAFKRKHQDSTYVQKVYEKFVFQPAIMVNFVSPVKPQTSIMLQAEYNERFWAGVNYRTQDAVSIMLGMNITSRIKLGYSYDISVGDLTPYNSGSHEIMLSFITTSNPPSLDAKDDELNNGIFEDNKKKILKEK
ncbi:MAG: PorP/SprF family type IX secretion system membrane protein [Putridiphycobacter sp.]